MALEVEGAAGHYRVCLGSITKHKVLGHPALGRNLFNGFMGSHG